MKSLHMVAFVLLIIGGLNWGLGAFGVNLVNMLLGNWPTLERIIYLLVGASAVYELITHRDNCKECTK